jgi:hypothetical protein
MMLDVNLTPEDAEGEQRSFQNSFGYLAHVIIDRSPLTLKLKY